MKTVAITDEAGRRRYRMSMYAGDTQRIEFIAAQAAVTAVWTARGGEVSSTTAGRVTACVFTANDTAGSADLQVEMTFADGTVRKVRFDIEVLDAL